LSVFLGVSWDKGSKKWKARVHHAAKQMYVSSSHHFLSYFSCRYVGTFSDEADAARAVDQRYTELGRPAVNAAVLAGTQERPVKVPSSSSIFSGVHWKQSNKKWMAQISHAGKHMYVSSSHHFLSHSSCRYIGTFSDEADAARAADAAYAERGEPPRNVALLAQPRAATVAARGAAAAAAATSPPWRQLAGSAAAAAAAAAASQPRRRPASAAAAAAASPPLQLAASAAPQSKAPSSAFWGVYWNKSSKKWGARIFVDGKEKYVSSSNHFLSHLFRRHIGTFSDEADAARAVDAARAEHGQPRRNVALLAQPLAATVAAGGAAAAAAAAAPRPPQRGASAAAPAEEVADLTLPWYGNGSDKDASPRAAKRARLRVSSAEASTSAFFAALAHGVL